MKPTHSFQGDLNELLKDPAEAAVHLNAALEDGDRRAFLAALREVTDAQGGMSSLARRTQLHRVNLYRLLSKRGNPEMHSLETILKALGLRLSISEIKPTSAEIPLA